MLASEDEDSCSVKENQTKALRSLSGEFKSGITSKNGATSNNLWFCMSPDHHSPTLVFTATSLHGRTSAVPGLMAHFSVPFSSSHPVLHRASDKSRLHQETPQNDMSCWWLQIMRLLEWHFSDIAFSCANLAEQSVNYANGVIKRKQQNESHVSVTSRWLQCHTERKTTWKFDSWLATCF